jgi:hypothetical protein
VEILAKLNPASQRYDSISHGTSKDGLTGLDVAAALSMAKLRPLAYQYARAKYALDEDARETLFLMLINVAKRKWGDDRAEYVAYLTITRNIDSNRCRSCHGTGFNRKAKPCKACNGSGVYQATDAQNARVMGISRQAYSKTWAERVTEMDRIMTVTDQQVRSRVGWALREARD